MTCCVLIHGTFSLRRWARDPNSPIRNAIRAKIPTARFEPFEWSGWHSQGARSRAAKKLKMHLAELSRRHEQIVVVGHSHGGNVGLQAIQDLHCSPVGSFALVTLATPFLYARAANESRNIRAVAAGVLALTFLGAIGGIFMHMPLWALSTIAAFAAAVALFAGAVLTSHDWVPLLTGRIAPWLVKRRPAYERMALVRPIRMLVVYYPDQDGITNLFNSVRRCSLRTAKASRRAWSRASAEEERWFARSPNRVPAICIATAGALAILNLGVDSDRYRAVLVIAILILALIGLIAFIRNYARPSFFGFVALSSLFLNGLSKLVYSIAKSGLSLDFLFMFVRARILPFNPHRYPVQTFCLEADDADHGWWRRLLDHLTFATHREIVVEPMAMAGIAEWIVVQGHSTQGPT